MRGKSGEIQEVISDILRYEGTIRSVELVNQVCKEVKCSPKPVYQNLKNLVSIGEIGLDEFPNGDKEYYSIFMTDEASKAIEGNRISLNAIETFNIEANKIINKLDKTKQFQLLDVQFRMHEILYASYKCMEIYPVLKKNKEFVKMKKEYERGFENTIRIIDKIPTKKQRDELYLKLNQSRIYRHGKLNEEVNEIMKDFNIKVV